MHCELPRLAFLAPEGTYSHQAAYDRFGESVIYVEEKTIADAFNALSPEIPLALIPSENSTFGSVVETYDLLRCPKLGRSRFIRDEVTLSIQHCLLVRKGVQLQNITRVLSHEQALGQCSQFISKYLPKAAAVKTSSTAGAARELLSSPDAFCSAAICSKLCATLYDGLEVLREGIQNDNSNLTRFLLLSTSVNFPLPLPVSQKRPRRALIRVSTPIQEPQSRQLDMTKYITALHLSVTRIDRRPSPRTKAFHSVYFFEVEQQHLCEHGDVSSNNDKMAMWMKELEEGIQRVRAVGADAVLIGRW